MRAEELSELLNKLNLQRQRIRESIDRSRRELDIIEEHIVEVQRESTERLLNDERVDNALIEQAFQLDDDGSHHGHRKD
jgi:hypothetical protein